MKELFAILSYSLGVSFSLRRTSFLKTVRIQNKNDLLFGSLAYRLAFVLLPPVGLILNNQDKYAGKRGQMFNCLKLNHLDTDL
jgi:hypothetical protein